MIYSDFVGRKLQNKSAAGVESDPLGSDFLPHQDALTRWALRRGRSAIFADTGLGKTRMQLAWADRIHKHTGRPVLMLAPLAVAEQTRIEGESIGVRVVHDREESNENGIRITNYDRLHRFDPSRYAGVVLDESSIIKHHDSKTLRRLIDAFGDTPYRLCATATPAPNDWVELGTHAEFLGVCSRSEMLAEYFTHDGGETQKWRLKGHARAVFWRWVSSWGAMIRSPADLGFDASAYHLPPYRVHEHVVSSDGRPIDGMLFALEAQTLSERRDARRSSLESRVRACADVVNADNGEPWIVWCELNAEGDALRAAIPDAIEVRGSDAPEKKEEALMAFASGDARVLITKPKIAGFGLNWQHCARVAFVGVSDSFESQYQAIRRCWRYGQDRVVDVHVYASELEGAVTANLKRKEDDVLAMFEELSRETRDAVMESVMGRAKNINEYADDSMIRLPEFMRRAS